MLFPEIRNEIRIPHFNTTLLFNIELEMLPRAVRQRGRGASRLEGKN